MKNLIIIILFLIPARAFFQTDSSLVLQMHIYPAKTQVWVDGKMSVSNQFIVLPKGEHLITLWTDGYHPYDTTILVTEGGVKKFIKRLSVKNEYREFLKKEKQFNNLKLTSKAIQVGLIAGTAVATGVYYGKAKTTLGQCNDLKAEFEKSNSPNEVKALRQLYDSEKADFYKTRNATYIAAGSGILISGLFWKWRTSKFSNEKRSTYIDPERIRFNPGVGFNENHSSIYPTFNLIVKL